ncbi:pyridoxamine 5'-phosphate oxidase family protein [Chromobacterium vaccinii]|uniref:pyridoxamine 5'-phosphate oxidase family protein n=1 Tax=Chromobacterium vaccinii TaxID=1108595 RepID=UPI000617B24F|nr:pyridoxamine 5'-phosphate oxidase family protein [Chromobacterium vaccinii]
MTTPINRLGTLHETAIEQRDPCAHFATLITMDEEGQPTSRIVTLRSLDQDGIALLVNADSPKIRHWRMNGKWELSGFWPSIMVQYRLRCDAELEQTKAVRQEWLAKPHASRLADLYHQRVRPESAPLPSRQTLLDELAALDAELENDMAAPPAVSRLLLKPKLLEIGRASLADRLHDRRLYRLHAETWTETILVP